MSKSGIAFLSLCVGLIVGLLLGYLLFPSSKPAVPEVSLQTPDSSTAQVYFYLLNDSTLSRHTISGSRSGVVHTVDTVSVSWK